VPGPGTAGSGSKKKSLHATERDTPRVRKLRRAFAREVAGIPPDKLVSVDESGATTSMTRTRGRGLKGERVTGAVPQGHWQVTTILGALRMDGMAAAMTIPAATDTDVFMAFVDHVLAPALRPGEVVLLDNLSPHKAARVRASIEAVGARVLYLPPYSPDFNPIEPCWAKVKECLRATGARNQDDLNDAIAHALNSITRSDAKGFFKKCGYAVH
jgi:transposase